MADRVWVVDSSAAINLRELPPASALETVNRLIQATRDGLIAFPEQVYREVSQVRYADLANAYVGRAWEELVHPKVVDYEILHEVLNDPIGSLLVPPETTNIHHADAYVVALAVQLDRASYDVAVVCDEGRDRRGEHGDLIEVSIPTGCDAFDIPVIDLRGFLEAEGYL